MEKSFALSSNRLYELDGLRGIASLIVFFSHVYGVLIIKNGWFAEVNNSIIHVFWDGSASVVLFFVLSGFVLSLPYLSISNKEVDILPFTLRRLFRIYPAYIFAILMSLVFQWLLFNPSSLSSLSPWVNSLWRTNPITWKDIIFHIIMVGPYLDTHKIDPVIWSLVIEMKISLLFPFVIYALKKKILKALLLLSLIVMISGTFLKVAFIVYLPVFLLGSLIAKYLYPIHSRINKLPRSIFIFLLAIAILLYTCKFWLFPTTTASWIIDYVTALGASLFILFAFSVDGFSTVLKSRPVEFLGKISYSFYLLHLPILLTSFSLLFPLVRSIFICAVISLIISFLVSYFTYCYIEIPFQKLGKKVAKKSDVFIWNIRSGSFLSLKSNS